VSEKKRFSARVTVETVDRLDEEAERRGLNRSQTIERVVEEWDEAYDDKDDGARLVNVADWLAVIGLAFIGLTAMAWGAALLSAGAPVATSIFVLAGAVMLFGSTASIVGAAAAMVAANRPVRALLRSPSRRLRRVEVG
jgi:hypothetical protein